MRLVRLLLVLLLAGTALVFGLASGEGATPSTEYSTTQVSSPDPQPRGRWAERAAAAGDLTGDRVPDIFIASPMYDANGVTDSGRVYVLNGVTRAPIYRIDSPEPQAAAKFGFFIQNVGDENGDRRNDLAVGTDAQDVYTATGTVCGTPEPNGCNEDQGKAWVFSGADGKLLYAIDNPQPQGRAGNSARFGSRIGRAGDLNGDGKAEIIIGASNNDVPAGCGNTSPLPSGCRINQGQAFIFDGSNGRLFRTLDLPAADASPAGTCASNCGTFGLAVQSPGDTDGDKVPDQLVNAGSYSFYTGTGGICGTPEPNGCNEGQGREYLFSGKTGALLLRIDSPEPQAGAVFGFQDAAPNSPGDVNGDGSADVYANGFLQNGPTGAGEGRAWVFNGRTGALLYTLRDPTPEVGGQFGWSLSSVDYNKDRIPDLYVGQSPHHVAGATGSGGTYVFNGRNGSVLKALELPDADKQTSASADLGPNLGWTNAAIGDVNRDAQPDFVAGAPFANVAANQDDGRLYLFLSSDKAAPSKPVVTGPRKTTSKRPTYRFSAAGVDNAAREITFRCSFGRSLRACKAVVRPTLKPGRHVLRVQAVDPAGNASPVARVTIVVLKKR